MDRKNVSVGIYNFFVSVELIPIILLKFVKAWMYTNSTVKKACKIFNEKLFKMGLPEETARALTKEYASAKDYIFEGFLKRKSKTRTVNTKKLVDFMIF